MASVSEKVTHKLTFEQAEVIRSRVRAGERQTAVARDFGVTQAAVWAIMKGKAHARKITPATREERLERRRQRRFELEYGISWAEWLDLLAACDSSCMVCGLHVDDTRPHPQTGKPFLVCDHDHATGRVRGALCSNCNVAIGLASDSPETLRRMADYLERTL